MISDKFTNPLGISAKVKLLSNLKIKGNYGYITTNFNMMTGTIFQVDDIDYRVTNLVRITGFATYGLEIKRCDAHLSEEDKTILVKNTLLKIIYKPTGGFKPGYVL